MVQIKLNKSAFLDATKYLTLNMNSFFEHKESKPTSPFLLFGVNLRFQATPIVHDSGAQRIKLEFIQILDEKGMKP